jgi:hypothetical protein
MTTHSDFPSSPDEFTTGSSGEDFAAHDALASASNDAHPHVKTKDEPKGESKSLIAVALDTIEELSEAYLWDGGSAYVVVKNGTGGVRTLRVGSGQFNRWLTREARTRGKLLTSDTLKTVKLAVEARAEQEGISEAPSVRVAERENGDILIDLGDDDWRCALVTPAGVSVIPHPADGPYFERPPLMAALPMPKFTESGDGWRPMLKYINVSEAQWQLKLVATLMKFRARGPYPIETFSGEQGAGKTDSMKADKALTDPTRPGKKEHAPTSLRRPAREERTLKAAAHGAHVLAFDNVSSISPDLADMHCAIATGADLGGFKLYSDDEESIHNACRPQMFNGIPDLARQPDLADRALHYELERPAKPIEEKKLWDEFRAEWAVMFGGLLQLLAAAIRELPRAELPTDVDVRMMDFARFGEAVGIVLGWEPGSFTRLYAANRATHARDIAQGDRIWPALLALLDTDEFRAEGEWRGSPGQLRSALIASSGTVAGLGSSKWFPENGQAMGSYMRRMKQPLKAAGIVWERTNEHTRNGVEYRLAPVREEA